MVKFCTRCGHRLPSNDQQAAAIHPLFKHRQLFARKKKLTAQERLAVIFLRFRDPYQEQLETLHSLVAVSRILSMKYVTAQKVAYAF